MDYKLLLLIIAILITTIILFINREKFTTAYSNIKQHYIIPYDSHIKNYVNVILNSINKQYTNRQFHLIELESYKKEASLNEMEFTYTTRIFINDTLNNQAFTVIMNFTVLGNDITINYFNISNSVHLPNTLFTNIDTRNKIPKPNDNFNVYGKIDSEYVSYKSSDKDIGNVLDLMKNFEPIQNNNTLTPVVNKYAVGYTGVDPYYNPTINSDNLSMDHQLNSMFSSNNFSNGSGKIVY